MAKMTITGLQAAAKAYVDASKQAGVWASSADNIYKAVDKIGKMVTLNGDFSDKLPELDGDDLPLGKTIEEYFIDLVLPEAWTSCEVDGANALKPALPSVEDCSYSYTLGREKIKTTVPYDNVERAALNPEDAANMITDITLKLTQSYKLWKYSVKKQLLGNAIDKAVTANLVQTIAQPTDSTTGEAFIETIKKCAEDASFAHEDGLAGALIGATPSLTLYVKKGIIPNLEVQTMAGAFNREDLAMPVKIKVIDDFGSLTNTGVYAFLVDDRGVKLHRGYHAIRTDDNGEGDFINYIDHSEHTGFISKFVYMKAFKAE